MTNRQLITHYAICIIAAIAAGYYIHPAASILAFAAMSGILTTESETRKRP